MFDYIDFRNRKLHRLAVHIKPDIQFGIVLAILDEILDDAGPGELSRLKFSLLELINNSLRAQRNRQISSPIRMEYQLVQNGMRRGLQIQLEDSGGGFDTADLPYNIHAPVDDIDLNSEAFELYRDMHNQQRFGMGLLVTKRSFDIFRLEFIDENGEPAAYDPDSTRGTRITLVQWRKQND